MAEELLAPEEGASAPSAPVMDTDMGEVPAVVPADPLVGTFTDLTNSEAAELRSLRAEEAAIRAEIDAITGNLREKFIVLHERTREAWLKITQAHGLDLTKRVYGITRHEGKPVLKDMGPVPEGVDFDLTVNA